MEQLMAANECSPRKNMSVGAPISLLPRIGAFICLLMLTMSAAPAVAQQNESEAQLLARARKIHHRVLTLDTHKDISPLLASEAVPEDPAERERFITLHDPRIWGPNQLDFPKMRVGGLDVAFFIVYVGQGPLTPDGFATARETALTKFEAINRMCRRFPEHIELARSAEDLVRIVREGKLACAIGVENGYAMGEDLSSIEEFHRLGARYMSISHNGHSQLGDSHTPEEPLHGGLTDLGRRAIEEMNRVGIMVDVSHSGKRTMQLGLRPFSLKVEMFPTTVFF